MLNKKPKLQLLIRTALWVVLAQFLFVNISAALYAYKFTHLYDGPPPAPSRKNIFIKTWRLFIGPATYKMPYIANPSFPCEEIVLQTPGRLAIHAWYSQQEKAKGCVIFFHGITGNKTGLLPEAARFRDWGYNVMLVDLRGHGKSAGNVTSFGVAETEEVNQAFDFAVARGNQKVVLYGSSMGAAIVLKAAADHQIQPAAIIADMPFASLHDHIRARIRTLGFPSEPFAFLVTFWIGVERGYNGFDHDVASYAKKIKCPVLLQWGEQDRYVTKEETAAIYHNLPAAAKKLAVYTEADHQSYLQVDPLGWEKEVGTFARSVLQ